MVRLIKVWGLIVVTACLGLGAHARDKWDKIPNLDLVDIDGKHHTLAGLFEKPGLLVVAIFKHDCPLSNRWAPTLSQLTKKYTDIPFLIVNASDYIEERELRSAIKEAGLSKSILIPDRSHRVAKALMAKTTTETFLIYRDRSILFRGPIDDQYSIGVSREKPSQDYLKSAIEAALDGESVQLSELPSPGCVLDFLTDGRTTTSSPEFFPHIAEILQRRCQTCHRPGQAGFPLLTYEQVKDATGMIRYVVEEKLMPPWLASPWSGPFQNDRSLTSEEYDTLMAWLSNGAPRGNPSLAPRPVDWPQTWQYGKPDTVLEVPSYHVAATGSLPYRYVRVRTNFPEDRWVISSEFRTNHPQVVHHILVFIENSKADVSRGLAGHFTATVPGTPGIQYPPGLAVRLPKGSTLVFQIHYQPNGKSVDVTTDLGLRFSDSPPEHEVQTLSANTTSFYIPAHASNYRVEARHTFSGPFRITTLMPHMHLRGKAFRYELVVPDGKKKVLLEVPKWDFNWQLLYRLREPIDVPAGAYLKATAWYDNSSANPSNPDPNTSVRFGDQSSDEMMIGYFDGYDLPGAKNESKAEPREVEIRPFGEDRYPRQFFPPGPRFGPPRRFQ